MKLVRPTTLNHALDALVEPDAVAIAGGTALQLGWEAGGPKPSQLVDLSGLSLLHGVTYQEGWVRLGALTPLATLTADVQIAKHLPLLSRAARDVAGPSIRTMGTLGGNIGWRQGCLLPALLALEARLKLASLAADKTVALETYLQSDRPDLILSVHVPHQDDASWTWHKTGLRAAFTPGMVAVAGIWTNRQGRLDQLRLAAGSGATPPQRLAKLETDLAGRDASTVQIDDIAASMTAHDDNLRTSAYRRRVAGIALCDALKGLEPPPSTPTLHRPPATNALAGNTLLSREAAPSAWHVRPDLPAKIAGEPVFLTDRRDPSMLVATVVRAPYPHARLLHIDTSRAEALPGVHAVVTHEDIAGLNAFGIVIQDQPALCWDRVRYEGDPVAAIAAETNEIARIAATLIDVTYEVLPLVSDPQAALRADAPKLHPQGNLRKTVERTVGDVEAAFASAAHIVEDIYETPRQMHAFMETEGGFVEPTDDGGLIVHVGGQHGWRDRQQLARILNLPEEKIDVVSSPTGGAFGGKDDLTVQPILALLALKTGRPVRVHLTRRESARAGVKRNPFRIAMKSACNENGYLVAQKVDAVADGGAYASLSLGVIETAMEHACGPYVVPNIEARGRLVATNNGTCGAFRGFGCNEMTFAVESQIERLAQMVGLDAVTMRQKNVRRPGMPGYLGQKVAPSERLDEMLHSAAASTIWSLPVGLSDDGKHVLGTGMALCYQGNGLGTLPVDEGTVALALASDGKIEARYGLDELGQGLIPAVQSCVASALGVARQDIRVVHGNTSVSPDSGSTTASRGTYMAWKGAQETAPGLSRAIVGRAGAYLGMASDMLRLVPGGLARVGSNDEPPLLGFDALASWLGEQNLPVEKRFCAYPKTEYVEGNAHLVYIAGAVLVRVAINRINGMVAVLHLEQHSAAGPILDHASYLGQMEGGASQGLGMTLGEHIHIKDGRVLNGNFDTYSLPSLADRPSRALTFALDDLDPGDPYGPRGVGELGIAGIAPAVTNAVAGALGLKASGAWPTRLPLCPETLLTMMASS